MKRVNKVLAAALAAGMVLSGCGASASKTAESSTSEENKGAESVAAETKDQGSEELEGTLVYWSMWNDTEPQGEVWQEIIDGFMKKHPKVKVTVQWCGRDNKKILKPAMEGNETIDIFEYPFEIDLNEYVLDLTPYVDKVYDTTDGKPFKDTLIPSLLITPKTMTGRTDILPAVGYKPWMSLFMYNRAIFEEAGVTAEPKTWEDLDASCAKIKEAGYVPITFDDAYASWLPGMYLAREKARNGYRSL